LRGIETSIQRKSPDGENWENLLLFFFLLVSNS